MKHLTEDQILLLASKLQYQEHLSTEEGTLLAHCAFCTACYETLQAVSALLEVTETMASLTESLDDPCEHGAVIQVVILDTRAIMEQLYARTEEMEFYSPLPSLKRGLNDTSTANIRLENNESNITYDPATKTLYITLFSRDGSVPRATLKCGDRIEPIKFSEYDGVFAAEFHGLKDGEYQILID